MNAIAQDHRVGILEEYAKRKLELAAILRTLLHTAERRKDEMSVGECRRLLARLAEDRFNLAILGQFSRGKSSLMNSLLGVEKLPTGILPLTSVITTVAYGESERVLLQREGWAFPQEIELNQLAEYVTLHGNSGNEKHVTLAEVQLPSELLRLGVHFIDTPGVASAIRANTRTTRQFLPDADAAILVTSFESPLTEAELNFLREIREHVRKIFVVVNKQDLVAPAERGPVLESVRDSLRAAFEDAEFDLFALSARDALLAKQDASAEGLAASGLPIFESALTEFLRSDKVRELLVRAADRGVGLARQQEIAIRISRRARSPEEASAFEQRLQERLVSIAGEQGLMIQRMRNRLRFQFPRCCKERIGLWNAEAEAVLTSALRDWFLKDEGEIGGQALEDFWGQLSERSFSDCISLHRQELDGTFYELIQEENGAIEDLASRISKIPVDVLGGEYRGEPLPPHPIDCRPLVFRDIRAPLTSFQAPWWYELVPSGRPKQLLARRWLKRIPEYVRIYQIAAHSVLEMAVDDWVADLARQFTDQIGTTGSQVMGLLREEHTSADLPEVQHLLDRIQDFARDVLRMKAEDAQPSPMTFSGMAGNQRARSMSQCSICLRLDRTLWEFMARSQYDLSVNEADQRQHATRSGFCPLHTWQYETVSSPQGVCAAYPEVLTVFAKRLRLLAEDATSVQSIENGLRSMLPQQSSCAACELMASDEKAAADELARRLRGDDRTTPPLCASHLRAVLETEPGLEAAKGLVIEEARAFETLAEDMQNYVLKHTAVRHHLSTNAENHAAITGLSRLVGSRRIAAPWRIE
jgi:small GTP-binding protein